MTEHIPGFAGWAQADLPLALGAPPPGAYSLAQLAEAETLRRLAPALAALAGGRRQAALTMLHYSIYSITIALHAPLLVDGVALGTAPDQLGLVLDEQANLAAIWVGAVARCDAAQPAEYVAAQTHSLLAPVAAIAGRYGRVSARGCANIVLDALVAGCRRLARPAETRAHPLIAALIAAGPEGYQPARPLLARPDAGPPVAAYVPRTCCVLNKQPSAHACPTCPQYPDDATRLRMIHEWLGSLDDDGFRRETGRARVG